MHMCVITNELSEEPALYRRVPKYEFGLVANR